MTFLNNLKLRLEEAYIVEDFDSLQYIEYNPEESERVIEEFLQDVNEYDLAVKGLLYLQDYNGSDKLDAIRDVVKMFNLDQKDFEIQITTESLRLDTESIFNNFMSNIRDIIIKLWKKIIEFFKTNWVKFQAYYYNLTKNLFNVRKYIYGLRDKSPIVISPEMYNQFLEDFKPYLYFKDIDTNNSLKLSLGLALSIKEYFSRESINKRVSFINVYDGILRDKIKVSVFYKDNIKELLKTHNENGNKFVKLQNDSLITNIDLINNTLEYISFEDKIELSNIGDDYFNNSKISKGMKDKTFTEIDYICLARLAECVDDAKGFILSLQRDILKLEKSINNILYDKKDHDSILSDINIVSSQLCFKYISSIMTHIRLISKWVIIITNESKKKPINLLETELKKMRESSPGSYKIPGTNSKLLNPEDVELIKKGDIIYYTLSEEDWENIAKTDRILGGFCAITSIINRTRSQDELDTWRMSQIQDDDLWVIDSPDENNIGESIGMVFLDETIITNEHHPARFLFNITGDIRFFYYHELGHLMTGQHNCKSIINDEYYNPKLIINQAFTKYAYTEGENKADAYACIKTNISPEKVVTIRYDNYFNTLSKEDRTNDRVLKQSEKVKNDMLKNIKKQIGNMRKMVSLSMSEFVKSLIIDLGGDK